MWPCFTGCMTLWCNPRKSSDFEVCTVYVVCRLRKFACLILKKDWWTFFFFYCLWQENVYVLFMCWFGDILSAFKTRITVDVTTSSYVACMPYMRDNPEAALILHEVLFLSKSHDNSCLQGTLEIEPSSLYIMQEKKKSLCGHCYALKRKFFELL